MEQNTTNPTNEHPHEHGAAQHQEVLMPKDGGQPKWSRKKVMVSLIIVLILVGLGFLVYQYKGLVVAATVDGSAISRFKVIGELEKQGGKQTLDMLVNKQLVRNEAKKKNIAVSDSEIDEVIKQYEETYSGDGNSLDDVLSAQGMTREDLRKEIILQKQVEKLLADKVNVTDEEVQKFITDNKVPVEAGKEGEIKGQVRDQIKQDKLGLHSGELLEELRTKAKIKTFVNY